MPSDIRCSNPRWIVGGVTVQCKLVLILVLLAILPDVYTESHGPSPDFSRHTLIRPRVYHGRTKRQISSSKENDVEHADVLTVGFELDGVKRVLDLRLNTDLIPVGYQQRHQHRGTYKEHLPSKNELCHYQGSVRDVPGSWVALSTCRGLRGVVFDGENLHHIHPEKESLESNHYVYNHKDLVANHTCGYEGTPHHVPDHEHRKIVNRATRHKRATEVIRGPYNANRHSRYVELVLVIDKKEYIALDENLDKVYQHCKDIANIINALYMPLNIFIALVGVQVWTDTDEITLSTNGDTTLSNFLRYRREKLVQDMPNDNAQLLTRITFGGGVVGKALKGPICTYEFSGGVSMDHSNVVGLVAATVAHEMGHNFGMEHDSADCECPEEKCIMASSSGSSGPTHWSTCSLEHLALAFEHGMDYCLRNKPPKLFDSPICGNGFVEPGEQCDCGLKENCDNPCCNVTTCMLHSNASCATGECCDLKTCRPKSAGTECRSAEHECDLPEYCTGQSEYCPVDVFKMDGESCSMGKAFCYQGSCRTHNDQCKLLWGPTGSSSDAQCYDMNNRGTKHGNCGYNRVASSYVKCTDENLLCGMLHCKHLNERLEFGMESVAILSHSFINNGGKIIPCRSAIVDLGLNQVDPGLAPDGAKCAPGKMCVNQKCMTVADLRASVSGGKACPNNCGGNGVCNSLGHCHCSRGFRPPDCTQPGVGGSEDSGPAEDPNARNDFIMALYIIFLGIVPMIALSSFGVWYVRNPGQHWKKGMMSTTDRGHNGLSIKTIDRSSPLPRSIETIDSRLSQDPACASLLPKAQPDKPYNNNLFGQFKGFTITPIKSQTKTPEPNKPAPPPPTIPTVAIKTNIKTLPKNNPSRSSLLNTTSSFNDPSVAPTLPPLNPGCTARPLISSPVLAATTCTSVELVSPKTSTRPPDGPTRPAPAPPLSNDIQKPPRPNSTPLTNVLVPEPVEKKADKSGTLNRLANMLRPNSGIIKVGLQASQKDEKNTNSLPRTQHLKANKVIDKEILRNLEISNPIPQKEIEIPTPAISVIPAADTDKKNVVLRAQSMRDNKVTPRPTIQTFGSMRQTTPVKRPTSIPASTRPTAPPPGPPTSTAITTDKINETGKIPGLPGYQTPQVKNMQKVVDNAYDDCMNLVSDSSLTKITEESPTNDNIYAVIEEAVPEKNRKNPELEKQVDNEYKQPKRVETTSNSAGLESMGLLSEIVSEISNRNFDSIYSTATLKKGQEAENSKNMEDLGSNSSLGAYVNSNHYKSPGSIYSNSTSGKFNSSSSTTSSGYLNPSALNVPQQQSNKLVPDAKSLNKSKPVSLSSTNPNLNDEISKELGMKPAEEVVHRKPLAPLKTRGIQRASTNSKSEEDTVDGKEQPLKPPLGRTKTPPNIRTSKDSRQSVDTASKSKQGTKQSSNLDTVSQDSETKSNKNSTGSLDKDSHNKLSMKTVPCSPKDNGGRLNSPDLVSSCSNSNQNSTKSPDVLGNNPKLSLQPKNVQKTPTLPRGNAKATSTPPKPSNVVSKGTGPPLEKKKPFSVGGNVNVTKSLSTTAKDGTTKSALSKSNQKTETKTGDLGTKTNAVQRAASSKSNVASLQQKFEANRNVNASRTIPSVHKKTVGKTTETAGVKK
ncbi:disintegrin and metalloproteinase domain-containing protein 19 [Osmia bicornis bicornis]|uniref:disintegrin and metalloproteinase domain-containing protein 19 n=1 Tax=Osmia bicornis bicornis TaxID=1437191 RepID=UPI001EAF6D9E|nr:disintegrin and metalloproteinase domain-containing protein 19 [Osmia bicornis bicornis]